jgi:hypothetical protein
MSADDYVMAKPSIFSVKTLPKVYSRVQFKVFDTLADLDKELPIDASLVYIKSATGRARVQFYFDIVHRSARHKSRHMYKVGGHVGGCLVDIPDEVCRKLYDAPLYFEDAIRQLRAYVKTNCDTNLLSTSARYDRVAKTWTKIDVASLHSEAPAVFWLQPTDRSFSRLFPGDVQPLWQWRILQLNVLPDNSATIGGVHYGGDFIGNGQVHYDSQTIKQPIARLCEQYYSTCDAQTEFMVILRLNSECVGTFENQHEDVFKIDLAGDAFWTSFVRSKVISHDRQTMNLVYVFRGSLRNVDFTTLPERIRKILANVCCGSASLEALVRPRKRLFTLDDASMLTGSSRMTRTRIYQYLQDTSAGKPKFESTSLFWDSLHYFYLDAVLALLPLELPAYVLLWILGWLPVYVHAREIDRIRLIENVMRSRRKVLAARGESSSSNKQIKN